MKKSLLLIILVAIANSSCEVIESASPSNLGGDQSTIGEVGNTFFVGTQSGVDNFEAEVLELQNGVSTVTGSLLINDAQIRDVLKQFPEYQWEGNKLIGSKKYKITDKGIQNVYDDGDFILVKYDDKVGTKYTYNKGGKNLTRTIEYKSADDEYSYGFFDIKVTKVVETGRGIPGIKSFEYLLNHKFGLVGFKINFEDGSSKEIRFYSRAEN